MAKGDGRISDSVMQQLKRQRVDPNVTFIGRRTDAGVIGGTGQVASQSANLASDMIVWIARHSVLPDKPQIRSVTLVDGDSARDAMLDTFIDAVLPDTEKNLAPILPGRVEVTDQTSLQILRTALTPLAVEVVLAKSTADLDLIIDRLQSDLRNQITPLPMWDVPIELKRELATAAANCYRRNPWATLGDVPAVEVAIHRFGIDAIWISLVGEEDRQRGIIAYLSEADFRRYHRAAFGIAELESAGGDPNNLDLSDEDIELVREVQLIHESAMGDAITIFYLDADAVGPALIREMQEHRIPFASREAIPHFMRVSRDGMVRRPNDDEIRALRLALDAFNYFYTRYHQDILNEAWHFGPITGIVQPKIDAARVPVKVSITSLGPTFDPALQDKVLRLRVFLEDDLTTWREIEILAQQNLMDLDTAIREAFAWPDDRESIFLPKDIYDGDETWETMMAEDFLTSDVAPIGLMLHRVRDFCHYLFDTTGESLDLIVRVRAVEERDEDVAYPQLVAAHGEPPEMQLLDEDLLDEESDDDDDDDEDDEL